MKIWIDPSELSTSSLLPEFTMDSQPCSELESITGCDFIVSSFPLSPSKSTLDSHIKSGALFCQRKSGYDFIGNFEQAHKEIARIQSCKIPMAQAFILAIGQYKPDDNGMLRITGKKPLKNNDSIKYDTLLALEAEYRYSGVNVIKLNDESEIETWLNAQLREIETIKARGNKKEVYPTLTPIVDIQDNFFQEIKEIPPDDIRSVLSGFPRLGQTRINAIFEYAKEFGVDSWGIYFLKIMADEDKDGKAKHKIKGIGNKLRSQWRSAFGLPKGYNLSVVELDHDPNEAFKRGQKMAMLVLADLVSKGFDSNTAYQKVLEFDYEFLEELDDDLQVKK